MEVVKNIAAILGVCISAASLVTLLSKTGRKALSKLFKKYGKHDKMSGSIAEIKSMLERHIEDEKEFRDNIVKMNEINIEFNKAQCRNIIKTIFYKYNDTKVLPLYEKKTLMNVEDLYINQMNGNSFAALLLEEMSHWTIDYENSYPDEETK